MNSRSSQRRRLALPRALFATALGLLGGNTSMAEFPEFNDVETRGSVSNPSGLAYWQFGDDDGDGVVNGSELDAPPVPIGPTLSTIASTNQLTTPKSSYSASNSSLGNAIRDGNGGIVGIAVDYQDFYLLPAPNSFAGVLGVFSASTFQTRPLFVQMGGVEVMQTLQFRTRPSEEESSEPIDSIDLSVGGRFFDFSTADPFVMQGLASMSVATAVTNQISGPQASVAWNRQTGRWRTTAASSLMVGYCDIEGSQNVSINRNLANSQLNQPFLLASTNANNSLDANDIAPLAELRLRASYDVTSSAALFLGYNLLYLGALRTPADSILWSLPSMGMQDRGGDDLSVSTLSMGIEWTH